MSPMPRYAARRDKNDPELVQLASRLGFKCVQLKEPMDYMVGFRGRWVGFVEIKDPKKEGWADEFTRPQREFMADCHTRDLPFFIWRTPEDVHAMVAQGRT